MRRDIKDLVIGRWREILIEAGAPSASMHGKHAPCPVCGGSDRFRFDDKEGRGTWFCNHCGAGDGWNLLMLVKGCEFKAAASFAKQLVGDADPIRPAERKEADYKPRLRELWRKSTRVEVGDPVKSYLVNRIGWFDVPKDLRTVRELEHRSDEGVSVHPAMLALVRDAHGDPVSLHRTYLTPDGHKANVDPVRMNMGKMPDGCAVRLAEYKTVLGVAEGIETALSAGQYFNLPVWACINAGRLEAWVPPEGVREVIVFGDNDANCVGQAAAYALAERLNRTITAQVLIPKQIDWDWNDVWQERRAEQEKRIA